MARLSEAFNSDNHEPTSFDAVPPGWYKVIMVASENKQTKSGDGHYINCEFKIVDSKGFDNRRLFDKLNLDNPSEKAVAIAKGTLSAMCRATGVKEIADTAELHGIPMLAKVKIRKYQGEDQNVIALYKPVDDEAAVAAMAKDADAGGFSF